MSFGRIAHRRIVSGEHDYGIQVENLKTRVDFDDRQVRIERYGDCRAGDRDDRQRRLRGIPQGYGDVRRATKSRAA
jgi:hypothetical protein